MALGSHAHGWENINKVRKLLLTATDISTLADYLPLRLGNVGVEWIFANPNFDKILPHCEASMPPARFTNRIMAKLDDNPLTSTDRILGAKAFKIPRTFDRVGFLTKITNSLPDFSAFCTTEDRSRCNTVVSSKNGVRILANTPSKVNGKPALGIEWQCVTPKEAWDCTLRLLVDADVARNRHYTDGKELFVYMWGKFSEEEKQTYFKCPELILPNKASDDYGELLHSLDARVSNPPFIIHAAALHATKTLISTWGTCMAQDPHTAKTLAARISCTQKLKDMPHAFYMAALDGLPSFSSSPIVQGVGALECYKQKALDMDGLISFRDRISPTSARAEQVLRRINLEVDKSKLTSTSEEHEIGIF